MLSPDSAAKNKLLLPEMRACSSGRRSLPIDSSYFSLSVLKFVSSMLGVKVGRTSLGSRQVRPAQSKGPVSGYRGSWKLGVSTGTPTMDKRGADQSARECNVVPTFHRQIQTDQLLVDQELEYHIPSLVHKAVDRVSQILADLGVFHAGARVEAIEQNVSALPHHQ